MSHKITFTNCHSISRALSFEGPSSSFDKREKENFSICKKGKEQNQAQIDQILYDDALSLIFRFATNDGKYHKTLCAVRAVNKRWYCLLDTCYLESCWTRLEQEVEHPVLAKTISLIGRSVLSPMIVDQSGYSDQSDCDESMTDDQEECNQPAPGLVSTYFSRFADLTQNLREKGAPIPSTHTVIGFECSSYEQMQQSLDTAFKAIWTCMPENIRFLNTACKDILECMPKDIRFEEASISADAEAFREWLNSPIHRDKLACMTKLSLRGGGFKVLPLEIGVFSRLTELNLSANQLSMLPPIIDSLSQLKVLLLSGNQLTSLPRTIGNLSFLKTLIIAENKLGSLPDTIGNLSQLSCLQVHGNQLTNLPDTIGKLSLLKTLNIAGNKLIGLPDTIGNLFQLEDLSLNYNQLTSLPDTIGKLSQLTEFSFYENRLTNLPDTIGNLSQLGKVFTSGNPFIFLLNKDLDKTKRLKFKDVISKFLACSNYACRTPLASLCQMIHRGMGGEALKNAFQLLSHELQQDIRKAWTAIPSFSSSSSEVENDLFADRASFVTAIIAATQSQWRSLSEEQHNQIYIQVANLAGQPYDGALEWGRAHAEENIISLIDAIELVTQSRKRARE